MAKAVELKKTSQDKGLQPQDDQEVAPMLGSKVSEDTSGKGGGQHHSPVTDLQRVGVERHEWSGLST